MVTPGSATLAVQLFTNSLGNVLSLQKAHLLRKVKRIFPLEDAPSCLLSCAATVVPLSAHQATLVGHTGLPLSIPISASTLFDPLGPWVVAKSF